MVVSLIRLRSVFYGAALLEGNFPTKNRQREADG